MPAKNYTKRPHFEGYRLTAEISANAFSRILLAERISSHSHNYEQPVVIKWLYATPISVQQDRDSFQREIHSLRSVHYPHIVPILASGFLEEDNTSYLVMEYAPKGSLAERLQDRQPLSHDGALAILDQIGQALHYAHQWNITHGNLKPQNVLFDATGGAQLTDFHLNAGPLRSVTSEDVASVYTAPEQLTGQANQKSDLYALGCLAYEMFTGHKPFMTPSMTRPGIYYRTRRPSTPRMLNPRLPQRIENAILQAIEKEPEQRQSDIPAFLAALRGSESIIEQEKETTLPTLPMVAASLNVPVQAQQTTDSPEIAAPADAIAAETTFSVEQAMQNSVGDRAIVPRVSPALLAVDSGSPKRNLRHYLAVSVLLTYVTSFKARRIFLPAISLMNRLSDIRDITSNRLRFKRPAWAFIIMASLLVTAITGMLTLLLFASHAPQGKGLVQATNTQTLSPQIQPGSTPTTAAHSTPTTTTTTQSVTFTLTAIPTSMPTTVSTSNSSSTASTSNSSDNSSNSSSTSNSSDNSSDSSASPTPVVTAGSTPTQAPSIPPTPTPTPIPPTPTPTQIPTPTPTPIPASSCRVSYVAPSQWQGGFGVNMVVTNTGGAPINGWTLNFSFPGNQRITSGWGGHFSQQGNQVTVTDNGYNAQIAAGASVSLGFLGTWFGSNPSPTSFSLNGIQCH